MPNAKSIAARPTPRDKALTPQQERFCQLITSGLPGMTYRRAYSEAFGRQAKSEYDWKLITTDCWKIRQLPHVAARIEELSAAQAERQLATNERVLRDLLAIASANVADFFDEHGEPLGINELPRHMTAAVASVEMGEMGLKKIKFCDKNTAASTLLRVGGAFEKDNKQRGNPLAELAKLITGNIVGPGGLDIGGEDDA